MRARTGYKQKLRTQRTPEEKAAIQAWLDLRKLTPQQWLSKLELVRPSLRGPIARIIWWDFWSERLVSERWHQFDKYLPGCFVKGKMTPFTDDNSPSDQLREGLLKIGYPKYRVDLRFMAF